MPPRREPLLVLHIVGQYPMAGVAWQAIHYLLGLPGAGLGRLLRRGLRARRPTIPTAGGVTGECGYAVRYVADVMRRVGLGDRWAYLDMMRNETHGLSRARLDELYRTAAGIVNLCGATAPRDEHRQGARLIYVETDPGVRAAPDRTGRAVVARVPERTRRALHLRREPREPGLSGAARAVRLEEDPAARWCWSAGSGRPIPRRASSRRSRRSGTRARTSPGRARRTSGRSTPTSSVSSTFPDAPRRPSRWR